VISLRASIAMVWASGFGGAWSFGWACGAAGTEAESPAKAESGAQAKRANDPAAARIRVARRLNGPLGEIGILSVTSLDLAQAGIGFRNSGHKKVNSDLP
jgi:hypothetical protein